MENEQSQWTFDGSRLVIKVVPAPIFIRICLFFFGFLPLAAGLALLITSFAQGWFTPGMLLGLAFMVMISVFLLRMALWNSIGSEIILISGNNISYQADFGWMQGKVAEKQLETVSFGVETGEYAQDGFGKLRIGSGPDQMMSVIKIKIPQLEKLLEKLGESYPVHWETCDEELK